MARWRFAGGTGIGGALKFPLTLPAGDYIYTTAEDGDVELTSAEPIVIDRLHDYLMDSSEELILDSSGEPLQATVYI